MTVTPPYGMKWEQQIWDARPVWTVEPDIQIIETLAREYLHLPDSTSCTVTLHAQGCLSKIFKLDTTVGTYVMRVALPLNMPYKTQSEVATANFLRKQTSAPIVCVYAYDATNDNILRFPWVLMDFVAGHNVDRWTWRRMSDKKRIKLVRELAVFQCETYGMSFDRLGSLYQRPIPTSTAITSTDQFTHLDLLHYVFIVAIMALSKPLIVLYVIARLAVRYSPHSMKDGKPLGFYLGPIVSLDMLRAGEHVNRGPHYNTFDWFRSRLEGVISDNLAKNEEGLREGTEDSLDDAYRYRKVASWAQGLMKLLPLRLSPSDKQPSFHLYVPDLHGGNIMVNDDGDLVALIDWEFVSTVPGWRMCHLPKMLNVKEVTEEPSKEFFGHNLDTTRHEERYKDDEGINDLYWYALMDYQITQLLPVFWDEIEKRRPEIRVEYQRASFMKELQLAVEMAEEGVLWSNRPYVWLEKAMTGEDTSGILQGEIEAEGDMDGYSHLGYADTLEDYQGAEETASSDDNALSDGDKTLTEDEESNGEELQKIKDMIDSAPSAFSRSLQVDQQNLRD